MFNSKRKNKVSVGELSDSNFQFAASIVIGIKYIQSTYEVHTKYILSTYLVCTEYALSTYSVQGYACCILSLSPATLSTMEYNLCAYFVWHSAAMVHTQVSYETTCTGM